MKRMISFLLATVFLISTGTSVYANDVIDNVSNTEKILEQMEDIGYWKKEDVSVTRNSTVLEYIRYDNEESKVEISKDSGNEIITFYSEGKVNTIVVTPEGEYYWDEVAEENKIYGDSVTTFAVEPRVTTETWVSSTTPYDNGPYKFNKNMTKNLCIDLNKQVGSLALDVLLFILVPYVPMLKYLQGGLDKVNTFTMLVSAYKGEFPASEYVYVQEKYYNGESKTSGRPLEYCYQVWTRVAKTTTFNSFMKLVNGTEAQVTYAKQLIYA